MSVKRLREFLKAEELDTESVNRTDEPPTGEIFDICELCLWITIPRSY